MFKCLSLALLCVALTASAQSPLTEESPFFSIPGLDSISTAWFITSSDSTDIGFAHPFDMKILRLTAWDYRLVFLDGMAPLFGALRIDQQHTCQWSDFHRSGFEPSDSIAGATQMCLMQYGSYFDPQTDRIAVLFRIGARIGIYSFNASTNEFTLESTFASAAATDPVGIFWAFGQFFIADQTTRTIVRTDALGNLLSSYGRRGLYDDGYRWISPLSGYVDMANTLHLYVCDGWIGRMDHLTATSSDYNIYRYSQVWSAPEDSLGINLHEPAYWPGAGVAGLDRFTGRVYIWNSADSLQNATRSYEEWPDIWTSPVHIYQAGGRLVTACLSSTGGWVLRSYRANGASIDNPLPYPTDHWTQDMSPVSLTETWHVTNGDTLTIDAGVNVVLSHNAALAVDSRF
jgi:hypothetical protein